MSTPSARDWLLIDLCERLGLCLLPDEKSRFLEWVDPEVTAFTDALFDAEGLAVPGSGPLYAEVRATVARAFKRES